LLTLASNIIGKRSIVFFFFFEFVNFNGICRKKIERVIASFAQKDQEFLKTALKIFNPGANVIKLFTAVIYCHSMVIPSFCVIKQHYLGNYCRLAVNYRGICVTNVTKHNLT
jgi:hypothetical protein